MKDIKVRKFLHDYGLASINLDIESILSSGGPFSVTYDLADDRDTVSFYFAMHHSEDKEEFTRAVKFFELQRQLAEIAIDEITSRWLTLKESENAPTKGNYEEGEEDNIEESDSIDGGGTAGIVQEELDFDSEPEEERE